MLENILDTKPKNIAVCILTDLYVKNNGCSVMGDKISKLFLKYFPELDKHVGSLNKQKIKVAEISINDFSIINFPVKPEYVVVYQDIVNIIPSFRNKTFPGDVLPGWASLFFDRYIVQNSCIDLSKIQDKYELIYFGLPTETDYDNQNNKILYKNLKKYVDLSKLKFLKCNIGD